MISIGLNLLLGVLLFCALVMGARLEKRLRGLRQGHTDFAKAVGELDQAASRTETSLAALRAGTEQAKTELTSRIDQARLACQRLEKLSADAERLLNQPLPLPQALAQPAARTAAPPLAEAPSALARPAPDLMRPAAPIQTRPAPAAEPVRSRARHIDDDLFAMGAPPPRRAPEVERAPEAERAPVRKPAPAFIEPVVEDDPIVGASNVAAFAAPSSRQAREAFYREMLEGQGATPDPFESGEWARERRSMLAAVMGGRR